jgi:hypothetical protein
MLTYLPEKNEDKVVVGLAVLGDELHETTDRFIRSINYILEEERSDLVSSHGHVKGFDSPPSSVPCWAKPGYETAHQQALSV